MNLGACAALSKKPENGMWYRVIAIGHLSTALSSAHTKLAQSRFNPGTLLVPSARFATLYFSDDPIVAQFEVGAMLGTPSPGGHIPHPRFNFASLNVNIVLRDVIDLTDIASHAALATNAQELTGDWRGYKIRSSTTPISLPTGVAPTQELGHALFQTGVEGFRAISARVPYHKTLTVFTDNLQSGSSLAFADASGKVVHTVVP